MELTKIKKKGTIDIIGGYQQIGAYNNDSNNFYSTINLINPFEMTIK